MKLRLCMSHRPTFANHLKSLGRTVFPDNRIHGICPENPCQQLCFAVRRFLATELSPSYFPRFPLRPPLSSLPSPLPPNGALPQASSYRQAISHGFPSDHPVVASISLLPNGASTLPSLPYRSFPTELSPCYFPRFPFRPPSRRFRIRSSPQAISHGFPSVQPVATPVSLLPNGALPKLFPTVSPPSTLSSLLYSRLFPKELPNLFPHGFLSVHPVVASIYVPSQRTSPQPISHGFLSVHLVVASHTFPPNGPLPKLFPTVSLPSTLSSHPYRSLAASVTKREPKHRRCFWERILPFKGKIGFEIALGKRYHSNTRLTVKSVRRVVKMNALWTKGLTLTIQYCSAKAQKG